MVIQRQVLCQNCRYNLRGLDEDAVCPECGTSVAWTLEHLRLRRAEMPGPHFYMKRLGLLLPCAYLAWVVLSCGLGGHGGAFSALYALYPLTVLFQLVGIDSLGVVGGLLMVYLGGPLFYAGIGALLGLAIDAWKKRGC